MESMDLSDVVEDNHVDLEKVTKFVQELSKEPKGVILDDVPAQWPKNVKMV
jgi:hypothetical protein